MVLITAVMLAGCMDAPTSSNLPETEESDLRTVPTGTPAECPTGTGASGTLPGSDALYLICVPPGFDPDTGSLVVYAHGSVPPQLSVSLPNDVVGGAPVSQIVTGLGLAYATTSYRQNGLVVVDATKDLQRLVAQFRQLYGPIGGKTYAVGTSEGGLIATLATERHPQLFDGTLAICAPIGDFQREINYFDDFRLAFDFFFPSSLTGISLGNPIDIPQGVIDAFGTPSNPGLLALAIAAAVTNPLLQTNTNALLAAADIPLQVPADALAAAEFILRLLAYNILFTNDAQELLGGQPYDNVAPTDYDRVIDGLTVPSFEADQPALSHLRAMYETSGRLRSPLVTLYNVDDPIVPSWHELVYEAKVDAAGATAFLIAQIGSTNFGHCEFTLPEVLGAFGALAQAVTGEPLALVRTPVEPPLSAAKGR
jgi:pimeloyl-ACP methyl ester carboxylesterase